MDVKQVTVSTALIEEIYQYLSKETYINVAALIAKMQAEVVPQLTAPAAEQPPIEESNGGAA
jgi:hypothetical protein